MRGTPPSSAKPRAASAASVTGLTSATTCNHEGMLATGTNTELAKTSGKITTKPADCAASAPRTARATIKLLPCTSLIVPLTRPFGHR